MLIISRPFILSIHFRIYVFRAVSVPYFSSQLLQEMLSKADVGLAIVSINTKQIIQCDKNVKPCRVRPDRKLTVFVSIRHIRITLVCSKSPCSV